MYLILRAPSQIYNLIIRRISLKSSLFIFGCTESSLLCPGFLQLRRAGALSSCAVQASHCGGFSCCRARAPGTWAQQLRLPSSRAQAQQLWGRDFIAPRHVGSSWIRDQTYPTSPALAGGFFTTKEAPKMSSCITVANTYILLTACRGLLLTGAL